MPRRSGNRIRLLALAASLAVIAACGARPPRAVATADRAPVEPVARTDGAGDAPPGDARMPPGDVRMPPGDVRMPPGDVPERAAAAFSSALAAMASADWIEAELTLEDLTRDFPAFPGPYVNLAILYRRDGADVEAETALNRALAIAPGHPVANNELALLYRERGEFEAAEMAYRRAIEGDPAYALAHYNFGVLLDLYLKRESEALEQYEIYQSLAPGRDEEVGRWILDLRRRLGLPTETERVARENRQ